MRPLDELGGVYTDEGSNMDSTMADSFSFVGDYPAPSTPVTDTPKEKKPKVGGEKKKASENKVRCPRLYACSMEHVCIVLALYNPWEARHSNYV